MIKKITALIEVRKMTMLWFALIFGVLVFLGRIADEYYMAVFMMVFGFYFGRSTALDKAGEK